MRTEEVIQWIEELELQTLTDELKREIIEKIEEIDDDFIL